MGREERRLKGLEVTMILNNVILKNRNDYTPVSESESIF